MGGGGAAVSTWYSHEMGKGRRATRSSVSGHIKTPSPGGERSIVYKLWRAPTSNPPGHVIGINGPVEGTSLGVATMYYERGELVHHDQEANI